LPRPPNHPPAAATSRSERVGVRRPPPSSGPPRLRPPNAPSRDVRPDRLHHFGNKELSGSMATLRRSPL